MYHTGRTEEDRQKADKVFLHNMLYAIEEKTTKTKCIGFILRHLRRLRAMTYYSMVDEFGSSAFHDKGDF